ncbi:hypothetical protein [Salipaludibacillus daqingensis]|uniref:hypothetical protein n=1 Tax=Salipaludibacillus daqingensis TaxID=3041001 RepID=UPI0024740273|nr:hypothetical protein [Salipaludibacillus daqingensis]
MSDSFIRIMTLQSRLKSLDEEELSELRGLLAKNPCMCQSSTDCRGICAVERRVSFEVKRRTIT